MINKAGNLLAHILFLICGAALAPLLAQLVPLLLGVLEGVGGPMVVVMLVVVIFSAWVWFYRLVWAGRGQVHAPCWHNLAGRCQAQAQAP